MTLSCRPVFPRVRRAIAGVALAVLCFAEAEAQTADAVDALRTQFPVGSIDSVSRADAALGATSGAKARVEKDYKTTARNCLKTILVNDCLDAASALQRKRLADIDAVELEANRYKRRDRADHVEADRAQREAERRANAQADADLRARNRKSFEDKQAQAARDAAERAKADVKHANATPHKPAVKVAPPTAAEIAARQHAKNAADYTAKVAEAKEHEEAIQRRLASKAADRKRRADEKAAKEAKEAASQAAVRAAAAATPGATPPLSGTVPPNH